MQDAVKFRTGYMDNAVFDLEAVLDQSVEILTPVSDEFDTLVGTGFSGGLVVPALALRLKKNFVLVRKDSDDSHHGRGRLLGEIGRRWIFVDDFVSSGRTRNRVIERIRQAMLYEFYKPWETKLVGNYYYGEHVREPYTRVDQDEERAEARARKAREEQDEERRQTRLFDDYAMPIEFGIGRKPRSTPSRLTQWERDLLGLAGEEPPKDKPERHALRKRLLYLIEEKQNSKPAFAEFTKSDFKKS